MNIMRKIAPYLIAGILTLGIIGVANAAVLQGFQGGTGYGSTSTAAVGQFLQVASTSPWLTYVFAPASGGAGGVTTSSVLTQGQWVIASGPGSIYSTSSQPAITAFSPLSISPTGTILCSSCLTPSTGVTTFNGNSGAIVFSAPATTTINGFTGTVFDIINGGGISRSVTNGSTTFSFNNVFGFSSSTASLTTSTPYAVNGLHYANAANTGVTNASSALIYSSIGGIGVFQVLSIASTSQLYANSSTIQFLTDASGNKYSTSSAKGTVTTSSVLTQGQWVIAGGTGSIYSTSSQPALAVNGTSPLSSTGVSATGTATLTCITCNVSTSTATFGVTFDGGGTVISSIASSSPNIMAFGGTISGWQMTSDIACTASFDVWKAAGAIPTVANRISGTADPALSSQQYATSTTLTGWTTTFSTGDIFMMVATGTITGCTKATVGIVYKKN